MILNERKERLLNKTQTNQVCTASKIYRENFSEIGNCCECNESTVDALSQAYCATHENESWYDTASFLKMILKLSWKILNVKSSSKGKPKMDISKDPIRSLLDWKISFLREFTDFLSQWELYGSGLSKETFQALRQTCKAISDMACYLLNRLVFKYVLLGKIQSDTTESSLVGCVYCRGQIILNQLVKS